MSLRSFVLLKTFFDSVLFYQQLSYEKQGVEVNTSEYQNV